MRTWERVRVVEHCGGCGVPQAVGAPIQIVSLPNLQRRRRIRCVLCADGPLDADQILAFDEAEAIRAEIRLPSVQLAPEFTGVTRSLFDAKVAQTGEREE